MGHSKAFVAWYGPVVVLGFVGVSSGCFWGQRKMSIPEGAYCEFWSEPKGC